MIALLLLSAAPLLAQTSLTPVPPGVGPEPGQVFTPEPLAPGTPASIPAQPPGAVDVPSLQEGQLQGEPASSVFEQTHTTTDFGPPSPPDAGAAEWMPVRGPHTSLAQLRRGLDDVEARRTAERLVVDAQYRQRREALRADENFRELTWTQRRAQLRALAAGRDAQRRGVDDAARRLRGEIERRIKEIEE